MGRRARRGGFSNAAVRAVRAAAQTRNEEAMQVADAVYATAVTWQDAGKPLQFAPAVVTASYLALAACQASGVPPTRENLTDVTSLLVGAMEDAAQSLTPDVLADFRSRYGLAP